MDGNGTVGPTAENHSPSAGAGPSNEEKQVGALPTSEVLRRMSSGLVSWPNVTPHFIEEFIILESLEPFAISYMKNVLDDDLTTLPADCDFTAPRSSDECPNPEQARTATTAATEPTLTLDSRENLAPILPVLPPLLAPNAPMKPNEASIPASLWALNPVSCTRATGGPIPSPSLPEQTPAPASQMPPLLRIKPPGNWTVDEVAQFIEKLPGCAKYAGEFRDHLIDGQAMFLLEDRHLIETMGIKLGPAVKIWAVIKSVRETLQ